MKDPTELYPFTDDKLDELWAYAHIHTPTFVNDPVKFVLDACQDLCGHLQSPGQGGLQRGVRPWAPAEVRQESVQLADLHDQ